jgi:hypothetical protein
MSVYDTCPNPVEIRYFGERDSHWLCGCGFCPAPDQTAAQLPWDDLPERERELLDRPEET